MACVIERLGYDVDDEGRIHYHEKPSSYEDAERIAGRRLDRRRNYAIIDGAVCELVSWTQRCSGCSPCDPYNVGNGSGCEECGYTGKRRHYEWWALVTAQETCDA